jgi:hypothetical protein
MLSPPRITNKGMPGFLVWARRDSPALYAALVRKFPEVAAFENAYHLTDNAGIAGLSDVFKSIGGALSSASSKIGSFVKNSALPIFTAALPVAVAAKQAQVARSQVALAEAMQSPAQVAYDANGYPLTVRPTSGGSLSPLLLVGVGVAALGVFWLIRRKK